MSIGKRLNELREGGDWTLEDLAEASDVSAPYISKLERDKALPQRQTLEALLEILDPHAGDVLLERDRMELERLGYDPDAVRLVVALEQLDPRTRGAVVERFAADLANVVRQSDEAVEGSAAEIAEFVSRSGNGDVADEPAPERREFTAR